jgi:transcription elongation factor Elf1
MVTRDDRMDDRLFGSYRCPVCGHRDGAELDSRQLARQVDCSYCGTSLELRAAHEAAHRFAASLAEARASG